MAHPAMFPRRGSNTAVTSAPGTGTGIGNSFSDDYSPPVLIQPPPVAASSPGLHHPPQSLNIQSLQQTGAQIKKKSGFQITSVIPAQISASMSSNNSIAEDTESYDDLDESHTEDLSSSEILDVSLSRTTDLGEPERSSSEETLSNFQEAETPGAVSPNQPQHQIPHQNIMINGSAHHPHHHHLHHQHQVHPGLVAGPTKIASSVGGGPAPFSTFAQIPVEGTDNINVPVSNVMVSSTTPAPVTSNFGTAGMPCTVSGTPVTVTSSANAVISGMSGKSIQDVNITSMSSVSANLANSSLGCTNMNAISISGTGNVNTICGTGNGISAASNIVVNITNAGTVTDSRIAVVQQQQPATVGSRFRVVKLDSVSEPYKKGRWTCSEFYDKENAVPTTEGLSIFRAVENIRQTPVDVATSERESTSGSSVSSTVSTLSHYTESVGSGEMGAHSVMQQQAFQVMGAQQLDFSCGSQSMQVSSIPQSVSQSQLAQMQLHPQEVVHSQQKQGTLPSGQQAPINIAGVPPSLIHQQPVLPVTMSTVHQQQLPYSQQVQPVQTMSSVSQQQLPYSQQQANAPQMTTGHIASVTQSAVTGSMQEYVQHQQVMQTSSTTGRAAASVSIAQPPNIQGQIQPPGAQTQPVLAAPQPVMHAQGSVSGGGQIRTVSQPANLSAVVQQPSVVNQMAPPVMQPTVLLPASAPQMMHPSQTGIIQQGIPISALGLTQAAVLAPQTQLPPQTQVVESAVQGMTQQKPAISPIPPTAGGVQVSSNVPPNLSATSAVVPPQNAAPLSAAQNGSLIQNVGQPTISATSLTAPQSVPQQMVSQSSAQYPAPVPTQPMLSQVGDAKHSVDSQVISIPQVPFGEESPSVGSAVGQETISTSQEASATLFPLKTLPLTGNLMDGEEDSSSGASVVAIDNKIEQAMDLVKSHLMYAVREEVEVLKEQIKELIEKNSQLEQENNLLKTLASPEQLAQFQAQLQNASPPASTQTLGTTQQPTQPSSQSSGQSA